MFNNRKIKELENRLELLEDPYKFEVGETAGFSNGYGWYECLIIKRYQNKNGKKRYDCFINDANHLIEDETERSLKKVELTKQ